MEQSEKLCMAMARCFRGQDGELVLEHLRAITIGRVLGPNVSDNMLRHHEGQRQLVSHIGILIERGRNPNYNSPPLTGEIL